jgi:hypothetical protein
MSQQYTFTYLRGSSHRHPPRSGQNCGMEHHRIGCLTTTNSNKPKQTKRHFCVGFLRRLRESVDDALLLGIGYPKMKRYTTHYTLQQSYQFLINDLLYCISMESCDVMISCADYFAPYRWNYGRLDCNRFLISTSFV